MFGHHKGAFTGASSDSAGLFRSADGGTIFLDEILEMPYASQAKLLRVLQERRVRPVGGTEEVPVDARVIACTNQNVEQSIRNNEFREDLYYRLRVIRIQLPPLRSRADDIPALVAHFIAKFNDSHKRAVKGISKGALDLLTRYQWPGNVRELEAVVESFFALGKSDTIGKADLPSSITQRAGATPSGSQGAQEKMLTLLEGEQELLIQALKSAGGNKTQAAQLLGVSRPRLYKMMRRHGVDGKKDQE